MNRISEQRTLLQEMLEDCLGDVVTVVTVDSSEVRPLPGRVTALIEWPKLAYPTWDDDPEISWTVDLVAGTMATQAQQFALLTDAISLLVQHQVNVTSCEPIKFNDRAAYQITLGPIE